MANENGLKIEVKDFGPISEGEIEVKPLTIFIGPNNSGKSYTAVLIHSLYRAYSRRERGSYGIDLTEESAFKIVFQREGVYENSEIRIPKDTSTRRDIAGHLIKFLEDLLAEDIKNEIGNSLFCTIDRLVKINEKNFRIKVTHNINDIIIENLSNSLKIIGYQYPEINHLKDRFCKESPKEDTEFEIPETFKKYVHVEEVTYAEEISRYIREIIDSIFGMLGDFCRPSYYLPAARSGILQAHKALISGLIRSIPRVGKEGFSLPRLSGVVSDFITTIIEMPSEKGPFFNLACEFEKEIIHGSIAMKNMEEYRYPEIEYEYLDSSIPLHMASSTVSELAPLILYLKYVIKPGDNLIVEEPEAHLHPQNQSILAKYLVKLIKQNVHLILTTHSEFLLEKFSNFVMLSNIDEKTRVEKYGYDKEDYLLPEEISVCVFKPDKEGGNRIEKVEITKEEGISQEEFLRVHESLYDETYKLIKDIEK